MREIRLALPFAWVSGVGDNRIVDPMVIHHWLQLESVMLRNPGTYQLAFTCQGLMVKGLMG